MMIPIRLPSRPSPLERAGRLVAAAPLPPAAAVEEALELEDFDDVFGALEPLEPAGRCEVSGLAALLREPVEPLLPAPVPLPGLFDAPAPLAAALPAAGLPVPLAGLPLALPVSFLDPTVPALWLASFEPEDTVSDELAPLLDGVLLLLPAPWVAGDPLPAEAAPLSLGSRLGFGSAAGWPSSFDGGFFEPPAPPPAAPG